MRKYLALYVKELKIIKAPALFILISLALITVASQIFQYLSALNGYKCRWVNYELCFNNFFSSTINLNSAVTFMIAVIMIYSFISEGIGKNRTLTLALPVPKSSGMAFKFLAAMTFGIFAAYILALFCNRGGSFSGCVAHWQYCMGLSEPEKAVMRNCHVAVYDNFPFQVLFNWLGLINTIGPALSFAGNIFVFLSIVCLAQGVYYRFRILGFAAWGIGFSAALCSFILFFQHTSTIPFYNLMNPMDFHNPFLYLSFYQPVAAGIFFLGMGLILAAKYEDI